MIEVARYLNNMEAELARLTLASHGIGCTLLDQQMNNYFGFLGGGIMPVRLLVDEADAQEVIEILSED